MLVTLGWMWMCAWGQGGRSVRAGRWRVHGWYSKPFSKHPSVQEHPSLDRRTHWSRCSFAFLSPIKYWCLSLESWSEMAKLYHKSRTDVWVNSAKFRIFLSSVCICKRESATWSKFCKLLLELYLISNDEIRWFRFWHIPWDKNYFGQVAATEHLNLFYQRNDFRNKFSWDLSLD